MKRKYVKYLILLFMGISLMTVSCKTIKQPVKVTEVNDSLEGLGSKRQILKELNEKVKEYNFNDCYTFEVNVSGKKEKVAYRKNPLYIGTSNFVVEEKDNGEILYRELVYLDDTIKVKDNVIESFEDKDYVFEKLDIYPFLSLDLANYDVKMLSDNTYTINVPLDALLKITGLDEFFNEALGKNNYLLSDPITRFKLVNENVYLTFNLHEDNLKLNLKYDFDDNTISRPINIDLDMIIYNTVKESSSKFDKYSVVESKDINNVKHYKDLNEINVSLNKR